jgi:bifunctional DNA-binding transcriptional regulator/antitoxin component of YhaV-PrlF toxin-antitoxin module
MLFVQLLGECFGNRAYWIGFEFRASVDDSGWHIRMDVVVCAHTRFIRVAPHFARMSSDRVDSESKVSGNQANIPARIRRELDIDDGDTLRWQIEDDGTIRVQVVQQRSGTFSEFDGYDGDDQTDATSDHDAWGVDG